MEDQLFLSHLPWSISFSATKLYCLRVTRPNLISIYYGTFQLKFSQGKQFFKIFISPEKLLETLCVIMNIYIFAFYWKL